MLEQLFGMDIWHYVYSFKNNFQNEKVLQYFTLSHTKILVTQGPGSVVHPDVNECYTKQEFN